MTHEFLTNKWILGAVSFIIMFAGVCYLWYQYQLAPYEKQAADTAEIVHQWEKNQKGQRNSSAAERTTEEELTDSDTPMPDDTAPPSTRETAAKTIDRTEPIETDAVSADAIDPSKMSRFGLGPYPEIPNEWNLIPNYWETAESIEEELLYRVTIKMHNEGIRSKYGSVGINPTTLLIIAVERGSVLIETEIDENGEERIYRNLAHPDDLSGIYTRRSEIPSHLKIVTPAEIAFDPYEYLGLSK